MSALGTLPTLTAKLGAPASCQVLPVAAASNAAFAIVQFGGLDSGSGYEATLTNGGFLASRWDLWLRPNFGGQIKINAPSSEIPAFERIITHMGVPRLSHEGGLIFAGQRTVAEEFQLG